MDYGWAGYGVVALLAILACLLVMSRVPGRPGTLRRFAMVTGVAIVGLAVVAFIAASVAVRGVYDLIGP